jgi:hypothetical protein
VLNAGGELEYDDCGTLRLYRPTDAERKNGCMFTRWACVYSACWAFSGACCDGVVLLCIRLASALHVVRSSVHNDKSSEGLAYMLPSIQKCALIHGSSNVPYPCAVLLRCRSLGDFSFKQPRPLLLCEPHVVHQQLAPSDSLLLLASDGVTDSLGDDDVMCIAMRALEQVSSTADALCSGTLTTSSNARVGALQLLADSSNITDDGNRAELEVCGYVKADATCAWYLPLAGAQPHR